MAGNSGCVGTEHSGRFRFTDLLININPLLVQFGANNKEHSRIFIQSQREFEGNSAGLNIYHIYI